MTPIIGIVISAILLITCFAFLMRKLSINCADGFSNLGSGLYHFVATMGLVAAGIWTISTFNLLHQKDIAEAQYKELQYKLKNIESSKISLATEVVDYQGMGSNGNSKGLIIKIKLTNVGNTPIEFDLSNTPLKIYEIAAQDTRMGYTKLYKPIIYSELAEMGGSKKNRPLSKFVSLTSSERELNYFAVLPSNKMYYIAFKTEAGDLSLIPETDKNNVPQCDSEEQCKWFVSKYLYLK